MRCYFCYKDCLESLDKAETCQELLRALLATAEFTAGRKALNESNFTSMTNISAGVEHICSVTNDVHSIDECHGMAIEVFLHERSQDLPVRSTEALNSVLIQINQTVCHFPFGKFNVAELCGCHSLILPEKALFHPKLE